MLLPVYVNSIKAIRGHEGDQRREEFGLRISRSSEVGKRGVGRLVWVIHTPASTFSSVSSGQQPRWTGLHTWRSRLAGQDCGSSNRSIFGTVGLGYHPWVQQRMS